MSKSLDHRIFRILDCIKKSSIVLILCIFFFSQLGTNLALGQSDKQDKIIAEKFYKFDPKASHATYDIAYAAMVAYHIDGEKTLEILREWPLNEIKALNLLFDSLFSEGSYMYDELSSRPMVYMRGNSILKSHLMKLAGEIKYSKVISGNLGSHSAISYGNSGFFDFIFYPENSNDVMLVHFGDGTVDYSEMDTYCCENRKIRIYFDNQENAVQIEYLSECENLYCKD